MSAFDQLNQEHKQIMRMLNIIDHTAEHIETGRPVPVEIVNDELTFIKDFAEDCHHAKEENVIFPAVESKMNKEQRDNLANLFYSHVIGRNYIKKARKNLNKAADGDENAAIEVAEDFKAYTSQLRDHIKKENVFLSEIKPLLNKKESSQLDDGCAEIEKKIGGHEHYLEMLDRLEGSEILRKQ